MKKLLILGGTKFIGRYLVEQLESLNKYDITLFNRQETNAHQFPHIKRIKGDRETTSIKQFTRQRWDCIIDLSCYYPESLEVLLSELKGKVKRYIFMSTLSAYQLDEEVLQTAISEDAETLSCNQSQRFDRTGASYGQRKAECERILLNTTWLDKIILRPSIVYGKYDLTDRLYYWLYRSRNEQPFILPGKETDKITLSYVGDLVNIIIQSIEIKDHRIIYNASTHPPLSLKEMVACMHNHAPLVNIAAEELIDNGIRPEEDIPLWFNTPLMLNNERLLKDFAMTLTSFNQSIDETASWYSDLDWPQPNTGLTFEKEAAFIKNHEK
jgi:2'-hydroxyisoflavone reductase